MIPAGRSSSASPRGEDGDCYEAWRRGATTEVDCLPKESSVSAGECRASEAM